MSVLSQQHLPVGLKHFGRGLEQLAPRLQRRPVSGVAGDKGRPAGVHAYIPGFHVGIAVVDRNVLDIHAQHLGHNLVGALLPMQALPGIHEEGFVECTGAMLHSQAKLTLPRTSTAPVAMSALSIIVTSSCGLQI
jgi:hypothetical protein